MAEFDAEAYLRAVGERWEPDDHEPGVLFNPVLAATAAALVAVDAITLARAQAIIDDYSPAPAPGIELLGEQIQLTAEPASSRAWAEPLPVQDPAVRHLWERVATLNDFHSPHLALDATIAALAATGAIPAQASVVAARAVLAVLRPDGVARTEPPGDLPGPWHSLLVRWGQTGGPVATIPVGAVTPSFDGVTAAVITLESRDEHFGISVELVPQVRTGLPYRDLPGQQHLTWWAADNLGNYYLGEQGSWGPRGGRCQGAILFWPALDARASSIDLMPTATTARAVIRVPLPRGWTLATRKAANGRNLRSPADSLMRRLTCEQAG